MQRSVREYNKIRESILGKCAKAGVLYVLTQSIILLYTTRFQLLRVYEVNFTYSAFRVKTKERVARKLV
jgi:hypothetical protein